MNKKQANTILGGLSNTSKMPCKSLGLPASECITGSKLRSIPGSICSTCYAHKGLYGFPVVQQAQHTRLAAWHVLDPKDWETAIIAAIGSDPFFRFFDSGDLQSGTMLHSICNIARNLPDCQIWLPTKESRIVSEYCKDNRIPKNLVIRLSATMVGGAPKQHIPSGCYTSTVHSVKGHPLHSRECLAYRTVKSGKVYGLRDYKRSKNSGEKIDFGYCGDCRACWSKRTANVSYPQH